MARTRLVVLMALLALLLSGLFQGLHDRVTVGRSEQVRTFPATDALVSALGGIRQYLAYTFFIKTDNLHHAYYGSLEKGVEILPYLITVTYLDPHYVDAYYVGSEIMFVNGKEEEAIRFNLRGLELNPSSGDLMASLANFYLRQKRYDEAAEMYRRALDAEDLNLVSRDLIFMGLGASLKAVGMPDEVRKVADDRIVYLRQLILKELMDQEVRSDLVKGVNDLESMRD